MGRRLLFDTLRAVALATVVGMIFLPLPYVRVGGTVLTLLQQLRTWQDDVIVPAWVLVGTLLLMWSSRQRGRSLVASGVRGLMLLFISGLLFARRFPIFSFEPRVELLASTVVDVAALVYLGAALLGFLLARPSEFAPD
jgi:hypothetical protein